MKKLLISLCFANTARAFFEVSRARPAEVDPDPCPETGCLQVSGGRARVCGRYRRTPTSETKMLCAYQTQCNTNSVVNSRSVYVYCNSFRNPNGYKCPAWQRHRTTDAEQTEELRCRADACTARQRLQEDGTCADCDTWQRGQLQGGYRQLCRPDNCDAR